MIVRAAELALWISVGLLPAVALLRWLTGPNAASRNPAHLILVLYSLYLSAPLFAGGAPSSVAQAAASPLGRLGWIALVGTSAMALLFSRHPRSVRGSAGRTARAALLLLFASQLLSSFFSPRLISANEILPPVAVLLVLTEFPSQFPERTGETARRACMIPITASLASFVLGLPWALYGLDRRTPSPWVTQRLAGVFAHPNALGAVAAAGLVLTAAFPPKRWPIPILMSTTALWLSDARTMMFATALALAVLALQKIGPGPRAKAMLFTTGVVSTLLLIASTIDEQGVEVSRDVATLNGRTALWDYGVSYWRSSPVVGVGSRAFDDAFRAQSGLDFAGQAHNQFVQSLAAEGLIGITALLLAIAVIVRIARQSARATHGASSALLTITIALLLVESPWKAARLSPGLFTLSLLLVVCLSHAEHQRNPASRQPEALVGR